MRRPQSNNGTQNSNRGSPIVLIHEPNNGQVLLPVSHSAGGKALLVQLTQPPNCPVINNGFATVRRRRVACYGR